MNDQKREAELGGFPIPKELQPAVEALFAQAKQANERVKRHCPQCGSDNYEVTCMGYIGGEDHNKGACWHCGWRGPVGELIPPRAASEQMTDPYGNTHALDQLDLVRLAFEYRNTSDPRLLSAIVSEIKRRDDRQKPSRQAFELAIKHKVMTVDEARDWYGMPPHRSPEIGASICESDPQFTREEVIDVWLRRPRAEQMPNDVNDHRRFKILRISNELLVGLLSNDGTRLLKIFGMPADARITGVSGDLFFNTNEIAVRVWSSTFPIVPEGCPLETFYLTVTENREFSEPATDETVERDLLRCGSAYQYLMEDGRRIRLDPTRVLSAQNHPVKPKHDGVSPLMATWREEHEVTTDGPCKIPNLWPWDNAKAAEANLTDEERAKLKADFKAMLEGSAPGTWMTLPSCPPELIGDASGANYARLKAQMPDRPNRGGDIIDPAGITVPAEIPVYEFRHGERVQVGTFSVKEKNENGVIGTVQFSEANIDEGETLKWSAVPDTIELEVKRPMQPLTMTGEMFRDCAITSGAVFDEWASKSAQKKVEADILGQPKPKGKVLLNDTEVESFDKAVQMAGSDDVIRLTEGYHETKVPTISPWATWDEVKPDDHDPDKPTVVGGV